MLCLIVYATIILPLVINGHKKRRNKGRVTSPCDQFSFDGTYKLMIAGENRTLFVCTDDDDAIYWGLNKELHDVKFFNYIYAVGRDADGESYYPAHNVYEAECRSFWFKENEDGIREIQYYLRYNPNKKNLQYTLSTATLEDESDSINNIYGLEKVSDEILGECMKPGKKGFNEIDYPAVYISEDRPEIDVNSGPCSDLGCNEVQRWENLNGPGCWGLFNQATNQFDLIGGEIALNNNVRYEWQHKLRFDASTDIADIGCCLVSTNLALAEENDSFLFIFKCQANDFGLMFRFFRTEDTFGECPLFFLENKV